MHCLMSPQSQSRPVQAAAAPVREMKPPSGMGIGDILKSIQKEEKKIVTKTPSSAAPAAPSLGLPKPALKKSSGSVASGVSGTSRKSPKNSVVIKL